MVICRIPDFQKSIWEELDIIKNRVRNLIWEANRWDEWRYKEKILQKAIRQYLPRDFSIWSWFIVEKIDRNVHISTQQDIIIYDNSYPVVFSEWDFVITTPSSVRAIIEVKSNIASYNKLNQIISKFSRIDDFVDFHNYNIFRWLFSYGTSINLRNIKNTIDTHIDKEKLHYLNHISLNNDYFMKYRKDEEELKYFSLYKIDWYSFSYFLSNLLHTICNPNKLLEIHPFNFSYPSENWKEDWLLCRIYFD